MERDRIEIGGGTVGGIAGWRIGRGRDPAAAGRTWARGSVGTRLMPASNKAARGLAEYGVPAWPGSLVPLGDAQCRVLGGSPQSTCDLRGPLTIGSQPVRDGVDASDQARVYLVEHGYLRVGSAGTDAAINVSAIS